MSKAQKRTVEAVIPAIRQMEGGGFEVRRPFPTAALPQVDPFLLLDHLGPIDLGPGQAKGAPDHPHRGFETVSYILEGAMEHEDSAGHAGRMNAGDVQWMTAGSGVIHSEMPVEELRRDGGRLHGFQVWVNLPAKDKMIKPRYQEIASAKIPELRRDDGVKVRVIAGRVGGVKGAVKTRTPVTYLHVVLPPGTRFEAAVPESQNATAYTISGDGEGELTVFAHDGDAVELRNDNLTASRELLVLAGEPLREPVARYGPFVMTTKAEIAEAVDDFQAGRFGAIARKRTRT
jgi:redox-sensitive bicupin YhaK (pirin superfamily)